MVEISEFVKSLSENPYIIIAGSVVGFLSFIGMFYFYFKGRKVKLPFYYSRSINVVENLDKFESLQMFYSGKQIKNFTITKLLFWNGGSDTIDSQDISKAEPIILYPTGSIEILNAKIIHVKNSASQFAIDIPPDYSHIKLQFDYLDPGDGAIIQIIHTGTSVKDIQGSGKIKGVGTPIEKRLPNEPIILSNRFISLSARKTHYCFSLAFFLLSVGPLYFLLFFLNNLSIIPITLIMFMFISFIFLVTLGIFFLKTIIPKGFESFYDEL